MFFTAAAAERGVSVLALTSALMHGVLGGRLIDAVPEMKCPPFSLPAGTRGCST